MDTDHNTPEGALPPATEPGERLTIPLSAAPMKAVDVRAAAGLDPDTPALTSAEIDGLAGDLLALSTDRKATGDAVDLLIDYIRFLEKLRCVTCLSSLGYHNYAGNNLCGQCANGIDPAPAQYPEPDEEEEHDDGAAAADVASVLAEAATWAARWAAEHSRAAEATAELRRITALHYPYLGDSGVLRCRGCIAGYDPRTGNLLHCAWPCPTEQARTGETVS